MCTYTTTTTFDGTNLTPNSVCIEEAPTSSDISIHVNGSTGITITGITSSPTLTWTQSGGTWQSSCMAMPSVDNDQQVDLTITFSSGERGPDGQLILHTHTIDPSFTVKNRTKCGS